MRPATYKTGPIDGIRFSIKNKLKHIRKIRRVVFKIAILHDDHVTIYILNAGANSSAFALVLCMV